MPEAAAKPELVVAPEEPAAPPARKVRLKEIIIDLKTPVQAHGETLNKMTFRRPTGGDLIAAGSDPITWQGSNRYQPNPAAMAEIMTILAAVPMSTIKAMDAEDFVTCAWALTRFFLPDDQAWQSLIATG